MLRRIAFALLFAIGAYVVAAVASYFLIQVLSSNTHDRSVEAAMTSAFFFGPAGAFIGLIVGFVFGGRRRLAVVREG